MLKWLARAPQLFRAREFDAGAAEHGAGPNNPCIVNNPDVDKAMLRRIIRTRLASIQHCYERELQVGNPQVTSGTVKTTFVIDMQGRVTGMRGDADPGVRAITSCVGDIVSGLQVPAMPGLVQVSYPFTFHAPE